MTHFERNNIYTSRPVVYLRYTNDIGTVVNSIAQANQLLETLNSQHQTINLKLPEEDPHFPLLDATLNFNSDRSLSPRLYTKSASKRTMTHTIRTQRKSRSWRTSWSGRAKTNSSVDNVTDSTNTAITKLMNNGYPADMIKQVEHAQRENQRRKPRRRTTDQATFRMPCTSNMVDHHRIEARLVHSKPRPLFQLAQPKLNPQYVSQRTPRLLTTTAWEHVWSTCEICKAIFLGSTVHVLHERAKEHLASAKNQTKASAIGYSLKTSTRNPSVNAFQSCVHHREGSTATKDRGGASNSHDEAPKTRAESRQASTFLPELCQLNTSESSSSALQNNQRLWKER